MEQARWWSWWHTDGRERRSEMAGLTRGADPSTHRWLGAVPGLTAVAGTRQEHAEMRLSLSLLSTSRQEDNAAVKGEGEGR